MVVVDVGNKVCPISRELCLGDRCGMFASVNVGNFTKRRDKRGCAVVVLAELIKRLDW